MDTISPVLIHKGEFSNPHAVCTDKDGNIYVADTWGNLIKKIDNSGTVSVIAGSGCAGFLDGPASNSRFFDPQGILIDNDRNIIVADSANHRIRIITPLGFVSTLAGNGSSESLDGPIDCASFFYPTGVALDKWGNIIVVDCHGHKVRRINRKEGVVETVAGRTSGYKDGPCKTAKFLFPYGVTIDLEGNLIVSDSANQKLRKIDLQTQMVSSIYTPTESVRHMTTDNEGNIIITNLWENKVQAVKILNTGLTHCRDIPYSTFDRPYAVALKKNGNLVVADTWNQRIVEIVNIEYFSQNWPHSHLKLPQVIQDRIIELLLITSSLSSPPSPCSFSEPTTPNESFSESTSSAESSIESLSESIQATKSIFPLPLPLSTPSVHFNLPKDIQIIFIKKLILLEIERATNLKRPILLG